MKLITFRAIPERPKVFVGAEPADASTQSTFSKVLTGVVLAGAVVILANSASSPAGHGVEMTRVRR